MPTRPIPGSGTRGIALTISSTSSLIFLAVSLVSSEKLNPILINAHIRMITNNAIIICQVTHQTKSPTALNDAHSVVSDPTAFALSPICASIHSLMTDVCNGFVFESGCAIHILKTLESSMIKISHILSIATIATGCMMSQSALCRQRCFLNLSLICMSKMFMRTIPGEKTIQSRR